eukprot:TRINITY_DN5903_c0_g1_i3.p2 TRINITY_DN5903_c0_g1~~TRINITY_DN5903_c0_g1_i3.p2  ORF type:complete len:137 (+),score=12.75 TRINITY_DN5903_c0_g1_i3:302-712(+)
MKHSKHIHNYSFGSSLVLFGSSFPLGDFFSSSSFSLLIISSFSLASFRKCSIKVCMSDELLKSQEFERTNLNCSKLVLFSSCEFWESSQRLFGEKWSSKFTENVLSLFIGLNTSFSALGLLCASKPSNDKKRRNLA